MNGLTSTGEQLHATNYNTLFLGKKVNDFYQQTTQNPASDFHLETGRQIVERLGYPMALLDKLPAEAINCFSGVGYFFHLADLKPGESVIDLGSGSGMDSFIASIQVGVSGHVTGIDMSDKHLLKAECLRIQSGFNNVCYLKGPIENTPCEDGSVDAVISNGVINLCADKYKVFQEVERLLKPGGRLVLSDIVTTKHLPEKIKSDTNSMTTCISGALHIDDYIETIDSSGLVGELIENNIDYQFISEDAQEVIREYGLKSISLRAIKPEIEHYVNFHIF